MKNCRIFALLLASVVCLAFCGCDNNDGPVIKKEVSRITHFLRVDVSSELAYIADVVCEYNNVHGEDVESLIFGASSYIDEKSWKPDMDVEEPTYITMTLKATPRVDSAVTESSHLFEASIMSELTVYDQNNSAMGYNGFEKSLSKSMPAGTNIKSFLESNFPVTYTFKIVKGNNAYNITIE